VTSSITSRNVQWPSSPAIVPGSRACRRLSKAWPIGPDRDEPSSGARSAISTTAVKTAISARVTSASQPTSAGVPLAIVLSNA
jgi:hypothetical protein